MNSLRRLTLILLALGLFLCGYSSAYAKGEWVKTESANFNIYGDANSIEINRTVSKLETFRSNFFRFFQLSEKISPISTKIIAFKSDAEFNNYLSSQSGNLKVNTANNFFREGQDTNYIILVADGLKEPDLRNVYHQYFHYLLSNYLGKGKIPVWLNEGLAEYYENFQTGSDELNNAAQLDERSLETLHQYKLLPADVFYSTDYYTLAQQEKDGQGIFYAQASAIVNYLIGTYGEGKFQQFNRLISSGTPLNESLIKAFQVDLSAVEISVKSYIEIPSAISKTNNIRVEYSKLNFASISDNEIDALLGDYFYQSNSYEKAEKHLLRYLAAVPYSSFAESTLGLVKVRQFYYDESFQRLQKAVEAKDADYLSYYRYAFALSRKGMTEYGFVSGYDPDTAEKINELLAKSIELNPNFAESYNLYALVGFVRYKNIDEANQYIDRALLIAPGNESYLLRKSELEMRKESFTEARAKAVNVYRNASDPGLRLYAQNTVQRIDSTEYQLMNARRKREKYPYDDIISDKPFSDEEVARLRAAALRESLNASLRRPAPGEKRILGSVIKVDCESNNINFTVKTGADTLSLKTDSFESLNLMSFNSDLTKAEIGCGIVKKENSAVVIYKSPIGSQLQSNGELVSIEFVPKDFFFPVKNQ